jgi:uncharacterized protein (UPF0333 family)
MIPFWVMFAVLVIAVVIAAGFVLESRFKKKAKSSVKTGMSEAIHDEDEDDDDDKVFVVAMFSPDGKEIHRWENVTSIDEVESYMQVTLKTRQGKGAEFFNAPYWRTFDKEKK